MKQLKTNKKNLNESFRRMVAQTTGVQDEARLQTLSEQAQTVYGVYQANAAAQARLANRYSQYGMLNEANVPGGQGVAGGANYNAAPGTVGGVYAPYQTLYNTMGIGNPVPAGRAALTGADYADGTQMGSGDKWNALFQLQMKVAAKTIGYELVNHMQLQSSTGSIPYLDYVYSGTKQPYGATPAYDSNTANVDHFGNSDKPYQNYGLPSMFKAAFADLDKSVVEFKKELREAKLVPGTPVTFNKGTGTELKAEYIGYSRIDGHPMFKVISGAANLGTIFDGEVKGTIVGKQISLKGVSNVSILEDSIQGFTGSGVNDRDPWYGTYQDGTVLYEPMSRGNPYTSKRTCT